MSWTKADRAEYVKQRLTEVGFSLRGRAADVAEELEVSYSQANAWLQGTLPRDTDEAMRIADLLQLDLLKWTYGRETSSLDTRKLMRSIAFAREVENENIEELGKMETWQFVEVVELDYSGRIAGAALVQGLAELAQINSKVKVGGLDE